MKISGAPNPTTGKYSSVPGIRRVSIDSCANDATGTVAAATAVLCARNSLRLISLKSGNVGSQIVDIRKV